VLKFRIVRPAPKSHTSHETATTDAEEHSEEPETTQNTVHIPGSFIEDPNTGTKVDEKFTVNDRVAIPNQQQIITTGLFAEREQAGEYSSDVSSTPAGPCPTWVWTRKDEDKKDMVWIMQKYTIVPKFEIPFDIHAPEFPSPNGEAHYYLLAQTQCIADINVSFHYMSDNAWTLARRYSLDARFMSRQEEIELNAGSDEYFPEYVELRIGPKPDCFTQIDDEDNRELLYTTEERSFKVELIFKRGIDYSSQVGKIHINAWHEDYLIHDYDQEGYYFIDNEVGRKALVALMQYQDEWRADEHSRYLTDVPEWTRPRLQDAATDRALKVQAYEKWIEQARMTGSEETVQHVQGLLNKLNATELYQPKVIDEQFRLSQLAKEQHRGPDGGVRPPPGFAHVAPGTYAPE
jgi:hypothetical protein